MGKKLSKFNENFIKKCDKNNNTGYFLEVDIEHLKTLFNSHMDLPFLPKRKKVEKLKNFFQYRRQRKICYSHKSYKTSIES